MPVTPSSPAPAEPVPSAAAPAPSLPREQIEAALSLWRPGATRTALVDFLDSVVNGPDPVPVALRVAAFDHDGTVAVEKPTESVFMFFEWWAQQDLHRESIPGSGAMKQVHRRLHHAGVHLPSPSSALRLPGHTVEKYQEAARDYLRSFVHPAMHRRWPELVYAPMVQLIDLLHRLGFQVWLVSGSSRDYLRAMHDSYHLPTDRILGTELPVSWRSGRLLRRVRPVRAMIGRTKPAALWGAAGRRPLLAVGNMGHDAPMLSEARFAMMVRHDDPQREFFYIDTAAERAARHHGWRLVSMRDDFAEVFAPIEPAAAAD